MKLVEFQNQRETILQIARRDGAKNVRVFGSVSRDEARAAASTPTFGIFALL